MSNRQQLRKNQRRKQRKKVQRSNKRKPKKIRSESNDYRMVSTALEKNELGLARLLVKRGCRINPPTSVITKTPLHLAVGMRDMRMVRMLLRKNASLEARNSRNMTALHFALKIQHEGIGRMILIDTCQKLGERFEETQSMTKLHVACLIKDFPLIQKYLDEGMNVNKAIHLNSPIYAEYTALHIAAESNNERMVRLLLSYGADVRIANSEDLTPLHLAEQRSPRNIIMTLLDAHENVFKYAINPTSPVGVSHLHIACKYSHDKVAMGFAMANREDVNVIATSSKWSTYPTPLHCAASVNNLYLVDHLLHNGADLSIVNCVGQTALHVAYHRYQNYSDIVHSMLEHVVAVLSPVVNPHDYFGISYLHIACCSKSHIIKKLIAAGADPNLSTFDLAKPDSFHPRLDYTPLQMAARYHSIENIRTLLRLGADVNGRNGAGDTALMKAVATANLPAMVALRKAGADVELEDAAGNTALINAAKHRSLSFVKLLIGKGTGVDKCDRLGRSPMYWACYYGKMINVQWLTAARCDMTTRDARGRTLLHAAMAPEMDGETDCDKMSNYNILVNQLLNAGLDVNSCDEFGNTPLHIACHKGNVHGIKMLIDYEAKIDLYNKDGQLPFELYLDRHPLMSMDIVPYCFAFRIAKLRHTRERVIPKNLDPVFCAVEPWLELKLMKKIEKILEKELTRMRTHHVDRYTTLYDLMYTHTNDMVVYVKNRKVSSFLRSNDIRSQYPILGGHVKKNFAKALKKVQLVERGKVAVSSIYKGIRLPLHCCEAILRHMEDEDIIALVMAMQVPKD